MGISSPSSDGNAASVGVDAIEDCTLDRGLGLGDLPDRPRRDARRWARS